MEAEACWDGSNANAGGRIEVCQNLGGIHESQHDGKAMERTPSRSCSLGHHWKVDTRPGNAKGKKNLTTSGESF